MNFFLLFIIIMHIPCWNMYPAEPYCPGTETGGSTGVNPLCPPGVGATDPNCVTVQSLLCRANKHNLPYSAQISAKKSNLSVTKNLDKSYHPQGNILFPNNSALATQLDGFLKKAETDPNFLIYFAKIHTLLLHELYIYLTKIFTSYNMTHIDKVDEYLTSEATQALNKKTLIINHLTTIIEGQANQAFIALFPTFPQDMASLGGGMLLKNDYGSNLNILMENYEDTLLGCKEAKDIITQYIGGDGTIKGMRNIYLENMGSYLSFFQNYLNVLEQQASTFIGYAQHIQDIITKATPTAPSIGYTPTKTDAYTAAIQAIRSANQINPPLFFYGGEILRSIRIVPALIQAMPKKAQPVPWPKQLVDDATSGAALHNKWGIPVQASSCGGQSYQVYPAFFTNAQNCKTNSLSEAKHLYVNIPTMQDMYTQEVLSDPSWIDSPQGIMKMLRACLGDFSALLSEELQKEPILDPCMYCILQNAAKAGGLSFTYNDEPCKQATEFLAKLHQYLPPQIDDTCGFAPTPPDNGGGPNDGSGPGGGGFMAQAPHTKKTGAKPMAKPTAKSEQTKKIPLKKQPPTKLRPMTPKQKGK